MARWLAIAGAWVFGVALFLAGAAYAVLGRDFIRRLLQLRTRAAARIETALQPPSPAELAAARASDTTSVALQRPDTASPEFIVAFLGTIMLVVIATFYLTGRPRRARR